MININTLLDDVKENIAHGSVHPGSLVIVSWKGSMFPLGKVLPINYMGTPGITLYLSKPYGDPAMTVDELKTSMEALIQTNNPTVINITEPDGSATRPPDHSDVMGMDGILLLRFV